MVELKISFSRYDYFGIILPGVLFSFSILLTVPAEIYITVGTQLQTFGELEIALVFFISLTMIFVSYFIGVLFSWIGSMALEQGVVDKKLKYPSFNLFNTTNARRFKKFKSPYSNAFISNFKGIFKSYFGYDFESAGTGEDIFKLCFSTVKESCPITYGRLSTFLALYGLHRNLTIVFLALIPFYLYFISLNPFAIIVVVLAPFLSYICFLNFLKWYRIYSDEVFRAFYVYVIKLQKKIMKESAKN